MTEYMIEVVKMDRSTRMLRGGTTEETALTRGRMFARLPTVDRVVITLAGAPVAQSIR